MESARRDPPRFTLNIDLLGHAQYEAFESGEAGGDEQPPYRAQFEVSAATRDRIFAAAQKLHYFQGDYDFRKHAVADTGRKTLTYRDGVRNSSTSLNWSENKDMQQLVDTFESIALTQNYARRLAYLRRFDKLGLDALLKRMEEMQRAHYLGELQAAAPVLREIAGDKGVMKLARDRANRLLDQVAATTVGAPGTQR